VSATSYAQEPVLVELTGRSKRTRRSLRLPRGLERFLGVALLLGGWQLASTTGVLTEQTLAAPGTVARAAWHLLEQGTLQTAMWVSLKRVLIGVSIGVPLATTLALLSGLSRLGEDVVDAPMQMLRFLPIIGLQPLILLWFGIGEAAKISLIVFGVAFPVYINTLAAVRAIDAGHFELAKVVGLRRFELIRRVVLPGALPGFVVGLRLAAAVAWLILVFAEQINAATGIGSLMIKAQEFFQTDVIVVCLVVYAALGLLSDALVRLLDRKVLAWQPRR
jgi:sulfonate transport system permease protein